LLNAQKEPAVPKDNQESRDHLRDAVAKHHRLQQTYDSLQLKFGNLHEKLIVAQKDAKLREEEAREARKRASGVHTQYKRLQEDHSAVLDQLEKLKQELELNKVPQESWEIASKVNVMSLQQDWEWIMILSYRYIFIVPSLGPSWTLLQYGLETRSAKQ